MPIDFNAKAAYASQATVYGANSGDSYYALGQTDASGNDVVQKDLIVLGNLDVKGTTQLESSTVVGGATAAPTVAFDVQSSAGRIEMAPAGNGLTIQGFDANGDTAAIGINTRDGTAPVNLPAVNATSLIATGGLAAASATLTGVMSSATVGGAAFTPTLVPAPGAGFANYGSIKMGTLLMCWGQVNVNSSATTITFPQAFAAPPGLSLTALGQDLNVGSGGIIGFTVFQCNALSATAANISMNTVSGFSTYSWFACGQSAA